ncbi:MAG TPA: hypothetical protein VIS29_16105 [Streptomyces sp.]|jgi:hypothetical protein
MNDYAHLAAALSSKPAAVPDGQAVVLLTVGDVAELVTARHPAGSPLRVPAARVAGQTGLPVGELPGRRFAVAHLSDSDADGFTLLDDPRL